MSALQPVPGDRPAPPAPRGWAAQAACRFEDPDLFYPPEREAGRYAAFQEAAAKQICRRCPVLRECLGSALAADERHGVWGGLSAEERARLRRRRA